MRMAIVGCGSSGTRLLRNLLACGFDGEVIAVDPTTRLRGDWSAENRVVAHVTDARSPLDVDVVCVCSPAHSRSEVYERVLKSTARHLFIDKPVVGYPEPRAANWRQTFTAMVAQMETVQVGYCWPMHETVRDLRRRLRWEGNRMEDCSFIWATAFNRAAWPGATYDHPVYEGSHEIATAIWMCGPVDRVMHVPRLNAFGSAEWTIVLTHTSGATSTSVIRDATKQPETFRALIALMPTTRLVCDLSSPDLIARMYQAEAQAFWSAIRGVRTDACGAEIAMQTLSVCDYVYGAGGAEAWVRG